MKLFLASSLDKTIPLLLARLPKDVKKSVLFIANAADPFEEKWWVDLDRKAFAKSGFEVVEVDLRTTDVERFQSALSEASIIHVCGGSVFHVLGLLKRTGIDEVIIEAVREHGVTYTGTSAGSIIASASTRIYEYDPEETKFVESAGDFSGLGFVPFIVVPHCNNPDFVAANKIVAEHAPHFPVPLIFLHDEHAVWVDNDKLEIVLS
jgi:dipeptidase E